ncbi:MAG: diguanylate cyclase [Piscirickettsiaceae bacterium CG_4_9_14_3_um_filter_43_564]|nr:EAL domain-containing protein [Thiomicrospira sp.]OIP94898.1 MAG: diguanylate cyclase [Thiomicrospira sp. CG2_30_44_34]PIQ05901.1 MAG: diguanylate cyclase [Piscirickettsiaceae bacterium CG18_big_fil_WC_8_21_14_2_50_44_103]PIU37670.1 MAG: diguanylate cyclase [Piscirickettsiaceae bacterium CG07_land_8_20_14_0_80_44_28]PIW57265.1 MAG: diguanylate cyclase [Piscirickettsiaceae bacterium CG12_big_fil_rev_8_21_14_0_65_44_934]PIW77074.1 MAG: diguanylate cyclase [Piscirickettsiaceae bacterium CG_4_8
MPLSKSSPQTQQPTTILIAESDENSRATLKNILLKNDFLVLEAKNGKEALKLFIQQSPSLVIMDAFLPEMDGYATTEAMRRHEKITVLPIFIITEKDNRQSAERAYQSGATDFIAKPINWIWLMRRIEYALKASHIEDRLRISQSQLAYAQRLARLGYWEWDAHSDRIIASESAFELFDVPNQEALTLNQFFRNIIPKDLPLVLGAIEDTTPEHPTLQISFRVFNHNNQLTYIDCLGEVTFDAQGKLSKITGSVQDISRLHRAEDLIDYQSTHDKLTDLANRFYFNQHLTAFTKQIDPNKTSATIILDIDRFKKVNDHLGQENGDALLRTVANRLKAVTRESDFIARLGSDEFAILIKNAESTQELNLSLSRIFYDVSKVIMMQDQEIFITFSMGVSILGQDGNSASELIAHANIARNEAKRAGGNQFMFYQTSMNAESKAQVLLENDLRKALSQHEIEVFFQPQVDAQTLIPTGAEALVRWRHPVHGMILPYKFIPIAESNGLIIEIGQYVLEQAIKQTEKWHEMGFSDLVIGVNLSSRQFSNPTLSEDIGTLLLDSTLDAKYLDLEITESLAMSRADKNIRILNNLKKLGVSISIDDFGTGYSSLAYLHSFPIDTIKIDRSFILNMETQEGQAIVKTILAMAKSLKLRVVAEGIEKQFHVDFFQKNRCQIFQGFKFGKPMPADAFTNYLMGFKS